MRAFHLWRFVCVLSLSVCVYSATVSSGSVPRFLPDDPLWRDPPPLPAENVRPRNMLPIVDFYKNSFHEKGERHSVAKVYASEGINTLGEVPDGAWYTNRHGRQRMSIEELARGPFRQGPPEQRGKWTVVSAKSQGVTPGFDIEDSRGIRYLLKFDPKSNPELVTAADVVTSRFLHAAGYHVPENYIVRFRRDQLAIKPGVMFEDRFRRERELRAEDIDDLLSLVSVSADGSIRAMASAYLEGKPLGPFKFYGRRDGDPNEDARHEHLRVLRGLYVFAAWLNHTDAKALNTLDMLVSAGGVNYVRHHLIDFGASLGSDSLYAKDPRLGHDYFLDFKPGLVQLVTLGLYVPFYARIDYPDNPAVGNFDADSFRPDRWKTNYPNAAFENRLSGDEFWAAKQVMVFTDEEIRAMVHTGEYSNAASEQLISDILCKRRDLIGRTFFADLLPLDGFRMNNRTLQFEDLAARHRFSGPQRYSVEWARWNNNAQQPAGQPVAGTADLPDVISSLPENSYAVATVRGDRPARSVRVFIRKHGGSWSVVALDREGANDWRGR